MIHLYLRERLRLGLLYYTMLGYPRPFLKVYARKYLTQKLLWSLWLRWFKVDLHYRWSKLHYGVAYPYKWKGLYRRALVYKYDYKINKDGSKKV